MTIPALVDSRFHHEHDRRHERHLRNKEIAHPSCYHSPSARVNANRRTLMILVHKSSRVLHLSTAAVVAPAKSTTPRASRHFDLDQLITSMVEKSLVFDADSAST
jgi:hypothetical protein